MVYRSAIVPKTVTQKLYKLLKTDLRIKFVDSEIQKFVRNHEEGLPLHMNLEAMQLLNNMNRGRRKKPFELVYRQHVSDKSRISVCISAL